MPTNLQRLVFWSCVVLTGALLPIVLAIACYVLNALAPFNYTAN